MSRMIVSACVSKQCHFCCVLFHVVWSFCVIFCRCWNFSFWNHHCVIGKRDAAIRPRFFRSVSSQSTIEIWLCFLSRFYSLPMWSSLSIAFFVCDVANSIFDTLIFRRPLQIDRAIRVFISWTRKRTAVFVIWFGRARQMCLFCFSVEITQFSLVQMDQHLIRFFVYFRFCHIASIHENRSTGFGAIRRAMREGSNVETSRESERAHRHSFSDDLESFCSTTTRATK